MSIGMRKILVPTDFSEPSRAAIRYGAALALRFQAELILLHVVQDLALVLPDALMPTPLPSPATEEFLANARKMLEAVAAEEKIEGVPVRYEVLVGAPFHEILALAEKEKADLIVMGTHGRGGLAHMLLGSVAEKVVRKSPCPVMTVRAGESPRGEEPPAAG